MLIKIPTAYHGNMLVTVINSEDKDDGITVKFNYEGLDQTQESCPFQLSKFARAVNYAHKTTRNTFKVATINNVHTDEIVGINVKHYRNELLCYEANYALQDAYSEVLLDSITLRKKGH